MNIAKLQKLKKFILAEPRRYQQEWWLYGPQSAVVLKQKPPCGTAGCLAGNTVLMEGYVPFGTSDEERFDSCNKPGGRSYEVRVTAMKILGLTEDQSRKLFEASCLGWGTIPRKGYQEATTPLQRAQAAAMEIDRLIALERAKSKKS